MEQAILKAIDGGYKLGDKIGWDDVALFPIVREDPLFWQALGKAMGWPDILEPKRPNEYSWLSNWHFFIDALASGQDADSFFNELIK